jgi:hypothetical protein
MDFNEYWQENKRFVLTVLGGAVMFMIVNQVIDSAIGDDLRSQRRTRNSVVKQLKEARFGATDLARARAQNGDLITAQEGLALSVGYPTRPEYQLDSSRGSAGNQYFTMVSNVRDNLLRRAGSRNMRLSQDLGLPALAPTRDDEIARHLDALDLIERVVSLAIDQGVDRVEKLSIKVDPGLRGRRGVGTVEKTRVSMKLIGDSGPVLRVIAGTQNSEYGASILIEELEVLPERTKPGQVRAELTFIASRLHAPKKDEN